MTIASKSAEGGITSRRWGFRWTILGLVCFIYMLVAADRANLGVALPSIKSEFHISNAEAGLFATLMFVAFAIAQIPASIICRRYGPRHLMIAALLLTAGAAFLIGTSGSTLDIKIYRSLLGVFEAFISVCCITTINNWFSVRDRGTATGYYWGASKMGPVICPPISVAILQAFGWRAIFQFFAVPVLVAAIVWVLFVKGNPADSEHVTPAEFDRIRGTEAPQGKIGRRAPVVQSVAFHRLDRLIRRKPIALISTGKDLFRSWNIIGVTLATILMVGIFNVFLAWIPSYLINAKHLSLTVVGIVAATPFAGAVAGNLAGGWVSDNLLDLRRKPLMMLGALFTGLAIVALIFSPSNAVLTGGLMLVMGFVLGLGYPHYSIYPMGLTTKATYPLAYGVTNTGAALGAAIFPFIAGLLLDHSSWNTVFAFLAASSILCLCFLATIDEPLPADAE